MDIQTGVNWKALKNQLSDPLYTNSMYIFATRALIVTAGFLFWMIAARLYPIGDVGLAVAIISSAGIVNLIATLGFEHSVIRFIPVYDIGKIVNSSIAIIVVSSIVVGAGYCVITLLLPTRSIIQDLPLGPIVFILFCIASSVAVLLGNTFLAMRRPLEYLTQNLFISSRVLILVPLVFLGSYGIFGSALLAYIASLSIMLYFLSRSIKIDLKIDREYIGSSFRYSTGNFIANLLMNLPALLLPIIVLAVLGPASAAIYYIAFTFGNFLSEGTYTLSTALFIEGSHGKELRKNVIRTALIAYSILVPGFLLFFFFGDYFLGLYGNVYAEGHTLLILMAFSSFFHAIYCIFCAIQKVRMGVGSLVGINALMCLSFISLSYILMMLVGITGVGYAMILTLIIVDLVVIVKARRERWI